jgi:tetratricopeptide (TPR) repeat protein
MDVALQTGRRPAEMRAGTDFERELHRLDDEIEALARRPAGELGQRHDAIRHASLRYQRAMLRGSWSELAEVEAALFRLLEQLGPLPDLCLLKGMLDLALHRLAAVRCDIEMAPTLASSWHGRALWADVAMQEGRYEQARQAYERVLVEARTWENLARLAELNLQLGDRVAADGLYAEAAEEITAKEPRAYAWVEVARGQIAFSYGDHSEARAHYERAQAAYSGYWLVDQHLAELLGAEGHFEAALTLYQRVVAQVSRPELLQAFGDLYAFIGQASEAQAWRGRARAGYLESARRGGVQYLHHLAEMYADVYVDGRRAVQWARRDFALRPNASSEAALAWAEYRNGEIVEALEHVRQALTSGLKSARLFLRSAEIHRAAGHLGVAEQHRQLAVQMNPRLSDFHVHR